MLVLLEEMPSHLYNTASHINQRSEGDGSTQSFGPPLICRLSSVTMMRERKEEGEGC